MPYKVVKFQETPNPNAVKCVLDAALAGSGEARRSFFSAEQAAGDPLALKLFAIPGVTNVLLADTWLTVNKSASAEWGPIKKSIRQVLGEAS